jgi:hypothetical protein
MKNTIFVQIASYRDPELLPTINDLIHKASRPDMLSFGICIQDTKEEIERLRHLLPKNSRITEVLWQNSKGLCWARSEIQKLYDDETWTLQLDSHHRFSQNWDKDLIDMWHQTGSEKAILTTYAHVYDPINGIKFAKNPYKMVADKFTESGTILFLPREFSEEEMIKNRPIRARFVSGHFFFTKGVHCKEYSYDPNIYFAGDEISLSIRSFTLGYDLFHPNKNVVWHEYTREGRPKHWGDHVLGNVEVAWHERDSVSKKRLRKMLREEINDSDITGYDLGTTRTHRDYELYAGIDFSNRLLQVVTTDGIEPPCEFINNDEWAAGFNKQYNLTFKWSETDVEMCDDIQFVYFGLENSTGDVLYRYDAPLNSAELLHRIFKKSINSTSKPSKLVIWPYSISGGWLKKTEFIIQV